MLFSGVFEDSSIFQDGGWDMDENGRNGRKWHLAQQLAQLVMSYKKQQITQLVIKPHIMQLSMTIFHTTRNIRMGGKIFFYL